MNILCDTNSITALRIGNPQVITYFETAGKIYLSVIVLGELLSGFKNGSRLADNMKFLEIFQSKPRVEILHLTPETPEIYSDIFTHLKKAGTPIPTNDLWIAAQCVEKGAVIISKDTHFEHIPTLRKMTF